MIETALDMDAQDILARAAEYRLHGLGLAIGLTVSLALYALVMSWAWIGADRG